VGLAVFAVIVMYLAREAITLVALSAVLAFLVAPVVRLLNNRLRVPRGLALAFGYLLVLIMVLLISVVVATGVFNSVREVDPPETIETLRKNAVSFLGNVEEVNVFGYDVDLSEVVGPLKESLNTSDSDEPGTSGTSGGSTPAAEPSQSQGTAPPKPAAAGDAGTDTETSGSSTIILGRDQFNLLAGSAVDSLRTVGGIVVALLVSALVTLMVAIYLSADSHKFREGAKRYIPRGYENDVWLLSNRVNRIWKGYLYGQLINSLATGFLVWLVLWAIGLPGAFVLGVIMALLNMIPTFGPVLAAVPGVLSAIALGSTRFEMSNIAFAILVVVVYLVVVQLQANVMAPFITGKAVSMSPATIIIGLVVGVQVAGLIGALLVVPVIATAKELVKYLASKLVDRDPFAPLDDPTPLADPTPTPDTAPDGIT
jgi:predicted PurR-regulated permease PerM